MEIKIKENEEYIKLDQLLKFANIVDTGSFAKNLILSGLVKVDGVVETRRGRKIYRNMIVEFDGKKVIVK